MAVKVNDVKSYREVCPRAAEEGKGRPVPFWGEWPVGGASFLYWRRRFLT